MTSKTLSLVLSSIALAAMSGPSYGATYSLDTGTATATIGDDAEPLWSAVFLNHFTATAASPIITSVSAVFGSGVSLSFVSTTDPVTFVIWNDPNGDGNPNDATVLSQASATLQVIDDGVTFVSQNLGPAFMSVGQSFFVGVYFQGYGVNKFPMGVSGGVTDSWVSYNNTGSVDLNDLDGSLAFGELDVLVGAGLVAMIRAEGIPEPTAFTLAFLGCAVPLLRRRRA